MSQIEAFKPTTNDKPKIKFPNFNSYKQKQKIKDSNFIHILTNYQQSNVIKKKQKKNALITVNNSTIHQKPMIKNKF